MAKTFNIYAHFMGTNPIIRTIEIGLIAFLLWHIILGLQLWIKNMARRKNPLRREAGQQDIPLVQPQHGHSRQPLS